jgi:hypothetical protein
LRGRFSRSLVTFLLCAAIWAAAQTASKGSQPAAAPATLTPDLQRIVGGLEEAQRENRAYMVPYTVTREYQLFAGNERQPRSTVLAEVRFQPPVTKTWNIKRTTGSSRDEKVVQKILEREARFAGAGISREDYDFRYLGLSEYGHRPCYMLQVVPKRDDSNLLRGKIWMDRDTYLIHHFEGKPAKSPSWWIKDLQLFTEYSDMGGLWLPNVRRGVADIRLFGSYTMTERTLSYQALR